MALGAPFEAATQFPEATVSGDMPEFERYDCGQCGEGYGTLPGSNAAENGYCSPACETAGTGL